MFSGPMFEKKESQWDQSVHDKNGAHYNVFEAKREYALDYIKMFFPDAECDENNLIVFSTSGIHGSYITIENIEKSLLKYGDKDLGEECPDDFYGDTLTFLIIQPRIVCMRYGNLRVKLEDIPYLKQLRESSRKHFSRIGYEDDNGG